MSTRQRFLEWAHSLPADAPDYVLEQALMDWNPALDDGTRDKMLSQLRLLTLSRVRRRWRAIWRLAEADTTRRFVTAFLMYARRARDGETGK